MPDSTINGLSALSGANVDSLADSLPIWDNSANSTKKITRSELFQSVPSLWVTDSIYLGNGSIEDPGTFVLDLSKTASSGNWRGFRDESSFTGTAGGQAYCNFDAAASLSGSYNYDHIVGFQSRPNHASSGTLTDLAGFSSIIRNNGGTVTNGWGLKVWDISGSGTVANQFGFYCNPLSKATNNWGVYIAGSTQSYFGGFVGVGSATVPDSLLHLEYPSTCNWKLKNSGSGVHVASYAGSSLGTVGTISNHDFFLYSNNAERLRAKTSGQIRFYPLSSAPSGAETGDVYFDSTTNKLRCYNGTSWNDLF